MYLFSCGVNEATTWIMNYLTPEKQNGQRRIKSCVGNEYIRMQWLSIEYKKTVCDKA